MKSEHKFKQRKELESWTKSPAFGSETEATSKQESLVEDEMSKQQEQVSTEVKVLKSTTYTV